jgi:hypothetical protein
VVLHKNDKVLCSPCVKALGISYRKPLVLTGTCSFIQSFFFGECRGFFWYFSEFCRVLFFQNSFGAQPDFFNVLEFLFYLRPARI